MRFYEIISRLRYAHTIINGIARTAEPEPKVKLLDTANLTDTVYEGRLLAFYGFDSTVYVPKNSLLLKDIDSMYASQIVGEECAHYVHHRLIGDRLVEMILPTKLRDGYGKVVRVADRCIGEVHKIRMNERVSHICNHVWCEGLAKLLSIRATSKMFRVKESVVVSNYRKLAEQKVSSYDLFDLMDYMYSRSVYYFSKYDNDQLSELLRKKTVTEDFESYLVKY